MSDTAELGEVIGEVPEVDEKSALPFVVETPGQALWCSGKMRAAEERAQAIDAQADVWIQAIRKWAADESAPYHQTVERMAELLEPWVRDQVVGQRKRSTRLPDGTVGGLRRGPERVEIVDEAAALEWCEEHLPSAIKVTRSVLKAPILARMKENGEVPPGIAFRPGEDRYYVDVRRKLETA
tara:strand:+ start:1346 stop:1891 length:546 start_codon:yes stop_codon:yes gene_type:complete